MDILNKITAKEEIPDYIKQLMIRSGIYGGRIVTDDVLVDFCNTKLRFLIANCDDVIAQHNLSPKGYKCYRIYNNALKWCANHNTDMITLTRACNGGEFGFVEGIFAEKKHLLEIMTDAGLFSRCECKFKPNAIDHIPWIEFDRKFFGGK